MVADITDFDLQNVDMAFVISQNNLNDALYEYIGDLHDDGSKKKGGRTVQFSFNLTTTMDLDPVVPYSENADIVFSGTLSVPQDTTIPVLDLSQSGADNEVGFNVSFDSATFTLGPNLDNKTYKMNSSQWVMPLLGYLTHITLPKTEQTSLPAWLQTSIGSLTSNYGDIFDINQILLDLSGLKVNSNLIPSYTPPEFSKTFSGGNDWTWLLKSMAAYIQANATQVFPELPAAGTAATAQQNTSSIPTYGPTAATFVIVPNLDAPNRSALVWALMTKDDTLPPTPANAFTNVKFFDDDTTSGYVIIGAPKFLSFLQSELTSSNNGFGADLYVEAVKDKAGVALSTSTISSCPAPTSIQPTSDTPSIASWSMPQQTSTAFGGSDSVSAYTDSSVLVQLGTHNLSNGCYNQVQLNGTVKYYVYTAYDDGKNPMITRQSPTLEYPWTAAFAIEPVESAVGVGFVADPSAWSFPTDPSLDQTTAYNWNGASPALVSQISSLFGNPIDALSANLKKGVAAGLPALGAFIFGGGGTFVFSTPIVNKSFSLVASLQYQNQG